VQIPSFDEFITEGSFFGGGKPYKPAPTTIIHGARTCYHGTTLEGAKSILERGFDPNQEAKMSNVKMPAVYFAFTPKTASSYVPSTRIEVEEYGRTKETYRNDWVVLEIEIDGKFISTTQRSDIRAVKEFCDQNGIKYYDPEKPGTFVGVGLELDWPAILERLKHMGVHGFFFKDGLAGSTSTYMVTDLSAIKSVKPKLYNLPDKVKGLGRKYNPPVWHGPYAPYRSW
jgi:hypothetical protein